jgi:Zn-dependent metalloprotease
VRGDATGPVRVVRDRSGIVSFVGTEAGRPVDNPGVSAATSVGAAARAHLGRYGAALGAARSGTSLKQTRAIHTKAGTDIVAYDQQVGGLPVFGGGVVVTLDKDRELASMLGTLSRATKFPAAKVSSATASRVARSAAVKAGARGAFRVIDQGRWVLDPDVAGGRLPGGAMAVHRFEVTDGVALRRIVLVDDQAGRVVMNLDQIQHADRVVCDLNNAAIDTSSPPLCTSGFARTEGQGPVAVADVNDAYDLSGAVSDFYDAVGDLDVTQLLGIDVGGDLKLASTVRVCDETQPCPYENAFWNGAQMYYGEDYASADDVVGHEMTHGMIDQYSMLLYWGQSGAMNESIADIMGEIVDQRRTGDDDSAWDLGEDLPIGAIRNLQDPTLGEDPDNIVNGSPDKMTSPFYWDDPDYFDNQGVHYNSGVGNKTAYLISQGGVFNGQTITGIDTGDPTLTRSAKLWLLTIQSLTSGSDYANLADVLEQSCQTLVGSGVTNASQCAQVQKAVLATELRTTPPALPQPPDAADTCPAGTTKTVLFDSETGASPTTKFTADSGSGSWIRDEYSFLGSNATSGLDSWFGVNPDPLYYGDENVNSLVTASGITLPAGQKTYLWFQGWYLFEYGSSPTSNYDGGAVEVDDLGTPAGPLDVAALPWVNGPDKVLTSATGNPAGGRKAFARDSNGWVASRVDLSAFAGKTVKPQFTTYGDDSASMIGWWLDDIRVYTCTPPAPSLSVVAGSVTVKGKTVVGKKLKAKVAGWSPAGVTYTYQWLRNGKVIKKATAKKYKLTGKDEGKKLQVRVTATKAGYTPATVTSKKTKKIKDE